MDQIERNYRALLSVALVLNSQRDMRSLWEAITVEITKAIPWARASITQYDPQTDAFRFYVLATTVPQVELGRDAVVPRHGSAMGWVYEHKTLHIRPDLKNEQVFPKINYTLKKGSDE